MRGPVAGFRGHLLSAAVVVAVALAWFLFLLSYGGGLPSLGEPYRVQVVAPTAASLASNARVTMAGADVGRVKSVEHRGVRALVEVEIDDDSVTPIPADSRVSIRQRTPVGENYISIEPGTSRSDLESGGALPASQNDEYVDVDQILSVLQGRTRQRARELIQSFGGALAGRGEEFNALMDGTARTVTAGGSVAELLGRDRGQISRLVQQFGDISRAVGQRGDGVRMMAREGLTTFRALADRDDDLRAMIDELPTMLTQVRSTTNTLGSVTDRAAPVLHNLAVAVRELRPTMELLRPAATEGRGILRELGTAAPGLELMLRRVRELSGPTADAMPHVREQFCELNPAVRYLRPYASDVTATLVGMSSAQNSYDATGHVNRVAGIVTEQYLIGAPPEVYEAARTLIQSGLLQETRQLGYDPYPPPNSVGTTPQGQGVLGPTDVDTPYRRITADC